MARAAVAKHGISWRSWWAEVADGTIPKQWQIESWPTMIVIDAHGIVRHRLTSAQYLDRIIETLLRETERS